MSTIRALRGSLAAAIVLTTATAAPAGEVGFGGAEIRVGADGLSPASLRLNAHGSLPFWVSNDIVAHTITFEDGRCTLTIPAGGRAFCGSSIGPYAGTFRYRVSDAWEAKGEVVVLPNERRVTMVGSRATARAGQAVTLSGTVFASGIAVFGGMNMPQAITVFRRSERSRRFVPIRRVRSTSRPSPCYCNPNENPWSVTVHPTTTATYVARIVDPPGETVWEEAESRRVLVRVIAGSPGPPP